MCCKKAKRLFNYLLPLIIYIALTVLVGCLLCGYCFEGNKRVELTIQYAVVVATFGASLIALFKDRYDRWCYSPKLEMSFDINDPVQFAKTILERNESDNTTIADDYSLSIRKEKSGVATGEKECIYHVKKEGQQKEKKEEGYSIRLKVCNEGLGWAEDVMVRIQSLNRNHLAPANLVWTNRQSKKLGIKQRTTQERLYLDLDYYCDLAEIYHDKYQICTEVDPFNLSNWFKIDSNEESFKLTLYAKNFMPESYKLKIKCKQYFVHDLSSEMKSKGVEVSLEKM